MSLAEERLQLKGRLLEAEQKKRELEIRIGALKRTIRADADPYREPDAADALALADSAKLHLEAVSAWTECVALVERLKRDLGE